MKARILALLCLFVAGSAVAQTAPPSQKVAPDKSKAAAAAPAPAKPATTQAQPAAPKAAAAPAKTKAAPKTAAAKKPAAKPAATAAKAAPKGPMKRDPFVSPVREGGGPGGPDCTVGKKCLAVDAILLRGIVRAPSGSIAVVESSTRKVTYFLRENDPVFNGYVVKITADSIMFRENVMDRLGKQSTRDVVKRVSAPPV